MGNWRFRSTHSIPIWRWLVNFTLRPLHSLRSPGKQVSGVWISPRPYMKDLGNWQIFASDGKGTAVCCMYRL